MTKLLKFRYNKLERFKYSKNREILLHEKQKYRYNHSTGEWGELLVLPPLPRKLMKPFKFKVYYE